MELDKVIDRLKRNDTLKKGEMTDFMEELMAGRLETDEVVRFLMSFALERLPVEILEEAALVMRKKALSIRPRSGKLLDTCGTGGDGLKTINVSTLAALVASAAGIAVAKHGNRAVTGLSGSADILMELGLSLDLRPEEVCRSIDEVGFGFMFAPVFHPAMKHAQEARKRIRERTIFNILGPLTNPASARHHLLGVFAPHLVDKMAQALGHLGARHVLAVHGEDGSDEVSLTAKTAVAEWKNGRIRTFTVSPEDFGLKRANARDLRLNSTEEVRRATEDVLRGKGGPHLDFVVLNSGFALKASDHASEVTQGASEARELLVSGRVREKLDQILRFQEKLLSERKEKG